MEDAETIKKQCRRCNELLPIDVFVSAKRGKYGKGSYCKPCDSADARERYARLRAEQGEEVKAVRAKGPADRDGLRMCRECEQWVPLEDYSRSGGNKSGRASYCRPCGNRRKVESNAARILEREGRTVKKIRTGGPEDRDGLRMCRDCEQWIPLASFPSSTSRASGHGSYCRPCMNARTRTNYAKWVQENEGREVRVVEDLPEGRKRCARCGEVKPIDEFVKASATVTGTHSYCKPCFNQATRDSVEKHHGSTRNYHLIRRYDLTEEEVAAKIEEQGGMCGICGMRKPPFHVDHDHESGKVRGMLCFNCNNGLGHFKDNVEVMRAAIAYVVHHYGYDEEARYVPEEMIDPKGTWALTERFFGEEFWDVPR